MSSSKQSHQNKDDTEQVDVKIAALVAVLIACIIGLMMAVAVYFNNQRRDAIIATYDTETKEALRGNELAYRSFFRDIFDACSGEWQLAQPEKRANGYSSDIICESAVKALGALNVQDLKDSSSIAYIRLVGGRVEIIEASGKYDKLESVIHSNEYNPVISYDESTRRDLREYLFEQKDINRWQDFITYIHGKEVIVPVLINGEIVGYIFRGVIER